MEGAGPVSGRETAPRLALDYDTYVTGMVAWLSNRLANGASAVYRRLFGIGVMEWRILAHLAIEPGSTGARIGRVIGLDKAAVSRTVGLLVARGMVRPSGGPSRGRRLMLSEAGSRLHDQVYEVAMQREARLLRGFSDAERATLRAFMARLLDDVPTAEDAAGS